MALITFSSRLHKDKTVYAVAGSHTQTILTLAKENHIPIDFGCGNGECGTCLVKVSSVDTKRSPMGGPLTNRETVVLKDMGYVTSRNSTKCTWTTFRRPNGAWLARWWCATRTSWSNTPASDVSSGRTASCAPDAPSASAACPLGRAAVWIGGRMNPRPIRITAPAVRQPAATLARRRR